MFDTFKNRLEITGILTTVTALRISAGRSSEPIGSDLPVIKDAIGRPFIPGSSFKGALRSPQISHKLNEKTILTHQNCLF
jgi:CRISPR/Cas system CSM-associated protein Csm3 (group 7 of RAMP superfamily)